MDMKEIYEILTSLEATAVELAAQRGVTEADLAGLERASADMEAALSRDDLDAWAKADESFHSQLLDLGGNDKLKSVVLNFWDRAHRARMVTLKLRPKPEKSTQDHAALVAALRRGKGNEAYLIHREHRERAGRELVELLQRLGLNQL
jgi:DNA-binding GntR family transcriptional regulator